MTYLKHPLTGTIIDVTPKRAKVLVDRGYIEVDADPADLARQGGVGPRSAVQPQPPIDTRENPPQPPIEARPDDAVGDGVIDTRPPNPLGDAAGSVEEADGAGLEHGSTEPPAASANKPEWVAFAVSQGMDEAEAESLTKPQLQERFAA